MGLFDNLAKKAVSSAGKKIAGAAAAGFAAGVGAAVTNNLLNKKKDEEPKIYFPDDFPQQKAETTPPPTPAAPPQPQKPSIYEDIDLSEFSPKMQLLMRNALEDGILSEVERRVLLKQAQVDGLDLDEFQMIWEAKQFQRQQQLKAQQMDQFAQGAPQNQAQPGGMMGGMHSPQMQNQPPKEAKCPNCGSLLPANAPMCPQCGYALSHVAANSSIERLNNLLREIDNRVLRSNDGERLEDDEAEEARVEMKCTAINNFAIPSSKNDLLEFLITLRQRATNDPKSALRKAYNQKREECVTKVQVFFNGDADFEPLLAAPKKKKWGLF